MTLPKVMSGQKMISPPFSLLRALPSTSRQGNPYGSLPTLPKYVPPATLVKRIK